MKHLCVAALLLLAPPACGQEARPDRKPNETVTLPTSTMKIEFAHIPGGAGKLKPFWIMTREVSWEEFDLFFEGKDLDGVDVDCRPTKAKSYLGQAGLPPHFMEPKRPVTNLRWHGAAAFCDWLSRRTGAYYRLPTEAEWEFAARAGDAAAAPAALDETAWHKGNSKDQTQPGAKKKPNAFGVHDMLGGVWEYCLESTQSPDFLPALRGGAWNTPAAELSYGLRTPLLQAWFDDDPNRPRSTWWVQSSFSQGFRVVRTADASTKKERDEYLPQIEVKVVKSEEKRLKYVAEKPAVEFFSRLSCTVKNAGPKALDELEVQGYPLNPKGGPHLVDIKGADKPGRATWGKVWPVLVNGFQEGAHRQPLKPGETRMFTIDFPQSFDGDEDVSDQFGARATRLRFSE